MCIIDVSGVLDTSNHLLSFLLLEDYFCECWGAIIRVGMTYEKNVILDPVCTAGEAGTLEPLSEEIFLKCLL